MVSVVRRWALSLAVRLVAAVGPLPVLLSVVLPVLSWVPRQLTTTDAAIAPMKIAMANATGLLAAAIDFSGKFEQHAGRFIPACFIFKG
jgi:hypothetical protein